MSEASSLVPGETAPPPPYCSSPPLYHAPPSEPFFPVTETSPTKSIKTFLFKIRLSEDPAKPPKMSYTLWTKAKLRAVIKDFPKLTGSP